MDLDEAWASDALAEGEEREVYTDALGVETSETLAPIPPPSLREGGSTSVNRHRLEQHTGQGAQPSKNGEALEGVFDLDRRRPASHLNERAHDRIRTVVSRNLKGAQPASEREEFQSRGDVYHGYNIHDAALSRQPKIHTVTNRATQQWLQYGTEFRGEDHRVIHAQPTTAMKAGAHEGDRTTTQARRAATSEPVLAAQHTHTGGSETLASQTPGQARLLRDGGAAGPHRRPEASLRDTHPHLPVRNLKTDAVTNGPRSVGHVAFHGQDDVKRSDAHRIDRSPYQHSTLLTPGAVGSADAMRTALPPPRALRFAEAAALAAHRVGSNDSTQSRDAPVMHHEAMQRTATAQVAPARRNDARVPLPSTADEQVRARSLAARRGRDAHADSHTVVRYVPNTSDEYVTVTGMTRRGRTGPDDAVHALHGAEERGQTHGFVASHPAALRLGPSDEPDVFQLNRRHDGTHHPLVGAIRALVARVLKTDRTAHTVDMAKGRENDVPVYVPPAAIERRLGDDGSLSRAHVPLSGGDVLHAVIPSHRQTCRREVEAPAVRSGNQTVLAPPMAAYVRRGRRD